MEPVTLNATRLSLDLMVVTAWYAQKDMKESEMTARSSVCP
jgi:hypothetical protein